jgi:hypothetical protein
MQSEDQVGDHTNRRCTGVPHIVSSNQPGSRLVVRYRTLRLKPLGYIAAEHWSRLCWLQFLCKLSYCSIVRFDGADASRTCI